jgi:hypothetical protein
LFSTKEDTLFILRSARKAKQSCGGNTPRWLRNGEDLGAGLGSLRWMKSWGRTVNRNNEGGMRTRLRYAFLPLPLYNEQTHRLCLGRPNIA